jgi:hypothetical protein
MTCQSKVGDRRTETTAEAVRPVRTLRFAVMNLRFDLVAALLLEILKIALHFCLLIVFTHRSLQNSGYKNHA